MISISNKRMKYLGEYEGVDFYKYSPTLFCPYYKNYPQQDHPNYESHLMHKLRMLIEFLRGGYTVFYMAYNNAIIGHLVVARGGRRLKVSEKEDIVIGPIYVSPSKRGYGLGTIGIRTILNSIDLSYRYAYEFISDNNIASIRTVEKNGYEFVSRAKEKGLMKNIIESKKGNYLVYRYCKE